MDKPRLLWVGDAACPSGFAEVTHSVLETVRKHYDVQVLGINYRGDPHPYPYPIWAAGVGGDFLGYGRLLWMCDEVKPDIIVLLNDPWNIPRYMRALSKAPEYANVPVVGSIAVDGLNCRGNMLNQLRHANFWTNFGLDEARKGGYHGPATVIPLGVDLHAYYKMDKIEARRLLKMPEDLDDAFIVGNVNRNQPRKRLDLTIQYFAEFVAKTGIDNAYLFLHVAPTGDSGYDVDQLAEYWGRFYDVNVRLIRQAPQIWYGVSLERMRATYNAFDIQISTTQGEGFGLTTFEGMACGVPQIVPAWSALLELVTGAASLVKCTNMITTADNINSIGGIADKEKFVEALIGVHHDASLRDLMSREGMRLVREERFRWSKIGEQWVGMLQEVLENAATKVA